MDPLGTKGYFIGTPLKGSTFWILPRGLGNKSMASRRCATASERDAGRLAGPQRVKAQRRIRAQEKCSEA